MPSDSLSTANYAAVIKDLRVKRDELDRMIKVLEAMSNVPAANQSLDKPERPSASTANTGIGDACARVLESANGALTTREVYAALMNSGFQFGTDNPLNNVWSALNHRTKAGDIEKAGRGRWKHVAPLEKQATHQLSHQNGLAAHQ